MTTRYAEAFLPSNLAGPGDARPTALQIVKDNHLEGELTDKVILVTGCSSGIGTETVRALKTTGAKIYGAVRNLEKGKKALSDVLEPGKVELLQLDTADFDSVRRCAEEFLSKEKKLNILINNAGIMAVPQRQLTKDGNESQFQTNHLGHFLLFQLLKPALLAASTPSFNSRVVNVSSSGHRHSRIVFDDPTLGGQPGSPTAYSPWVGYGQSKTASIYMANEIDRRYGAQGLHSWSVHPGGIIETGLIVHVDTKSMVIEPDAMKTLKNVEQGAATTVVAAVEKEIEGKGGKFLDNCAVSGPLEDESQMNVVTTPGTAPWVYDVEAAKKLWEVSSQLVGAA